MLFADESTDFVPKEWIYTDPKEGLVTKHMPPPYNKRNFVTFNSLIRSRPSIDFPPVSSWPSYPIQLRGQSGKLIFDFIKIISKDKKNFC